MQKSLTKHKLIILLMMLALISFLSFHSLIVEASSYYEPNVKETTLNTTESIDNVTGVEDDGSGESGTGETGTGEEGEPEVPETTFNGFVISTSIITDNYLYDALLTIYKATDSNYKGSSIYSDMFKDFTEINVDGKNISSLTGLDKLDLDNLETFSANLNNISIFDENVFVNTDINKFKNLSLASNSLNKFQITILTGLNNINLSSNKISNLDLSNIEAKVQNTEFTLNIANNNLTSMSSIILPTRRIGHININLINNQITEISEDYFTDKFTLDIGIQGFNLIDNKYYANTKNNVIIYKTNNPNLRIDIYKIDGESDELVNSIKDSDIVGNYLKLNLSVGEYEYEYMFDAENESAYSKYDSNRAYLGSNRFSVIPQKVSYLFNYKGKDYESLNKVTGVVLVKLSCEEGATILYQVNGGQWTEGNLIECNKGGTYSIKVKAVINGIESETENILVRTSLNLYIPDGLMLAFVLLIALVLFLIVLPIISKKYFKKD
ncbi:MAG: hypothetical protein ACI4PF_03630 [Christensenellales bacterium]